MQIDTSPLFSEHEVILLMACQLRTPKFDFAPQNESKNLKQFIMPFVTGLTRSPLQFISHLGVVQAIFLHFSMAPTPPLPPPPHPLLTKLLPPAMVLEHHRELLHYAEAS